MKKLLEEIKIDKALLKETLQKIVQSENLNEALFLANKTLTQLKKKDESKIIGKRNGELIWFEAFDEEQNISIQFAILENDFKEAVEALAFAETFGRSDILDLDGYLKVRNEVLYKELCEHEASDETYNLLYMMAKENEEIKEIKIAV